MARHLVIPCLLVLAIGSVRADSIVLTVDRGAIPTDSVIDWSEGTPPYHLYRSGSPSDVASASHVFANVSSGPVTDPDLPAPSGLFYYLVLHGTCGDHVIDAGEGCDDGNLSSGDGCSAICQSEHNRVFVSSTTFPTSLGNALAYDSQCNVLATAAGINNLANNAYVAWVSDGGSTARNRILARNPGARGWDRIDGKPFADTMSSLLSGVIYNAIRVDQNDVDVGDQRVLTGTNNDGMAATSNCSNWTGSGMNNPGDSAEGSGGWTAGPGATACSIARRIYCFETTRSTALTITPEAGSVVYLSTLYTPGSMTPDQKCQADRPVGAPGTAHALISSPSFSAASRLSPLVRFVRPDGIFVGTGAELGVGNLHSGIWQSATEYITLQERVWTGSNLPNSVGTAASTCNNWTSSSMFDSATTGLAPSTAAAWWNNFTRPCSNPARLYCFLQ